VAAGYTMPTVHRYFDTSARVFRATLDTEKLLKEMAEKNYATSLEVIQSNEKKIEDLNIKLQKALLEKDKFKTEQLQIQQRKLQKHNEEIILLKKEQELRIVTFHHSSIYQEFKQASTDENVNLCSAKSWHKWRELEKAIDDAYPHFREQLTILCPKLSVIEIQVCLLTKVGIAPIGIATLLKYSRQGISNIRTRIHKRIQKLSGEYANFDDFIDSF
jgi:exonuclease VII large subunit